MGHVCDKCVCPFISFWVLQRKNAKRNHIFMFKVTFQKERSGIYRCKVNSTSLVQFLQRKIIRQSCRSRKKIVAAVDLMWVHLVCSCMYACLSVCSCACVCVTIEPSCIKYSQWLSSWWPKTPWVDTGWIKSREKESFSFPLPSISTGLLRSCGIMVSSRGYEITVTCIRGSHSKAGKISWLT